MKVRGTRSMRYGVGGDEVAMVDELVILDVD
jgi:hypothetical protein